MQIRRGRSDDAVDACTVLRRSIIELCQTDHRGDKAFLGKWLANKTAANVQAWIAESHFLIAEEEGKILGVAAMNKAGKITLNYVSPDARFRGVSKALLQSLEDRARALGLDECSLESTQTARRFYEAAGYRETRREILPLTGTIVAVLSKPIRPLIANYTLNQVESDADWQTYHRIRRAVLFAARGRPEAYDAAHPDERHADNDPLLLWYLGLPVATVRLDRHGHGLGIIRMIAVDEPYQRKGHGRSLLTLVAERAKALDLRALQVNAAPDAVGFYLKSGFQIINGGREQPLMEKSLDI